MLTSRLFIFSSRLSSRVFFYLPEGTAFIFDHQMPVFMQHSY
ncbi:hypothetical protein JOC37_001923 [Desulfohalotomaculum tongense]|nr:hypothetical protein [Desulforadius tongensis]